MEVHQKKNEIFICQFKYAQNMIKKFAMEKCKPVATPIGHGIQLSKDDGASKVDKTSYKSMVGSLMFLTNTRPDI